MKETSINLSQFSLLLLQTLVSDPDVNVSYIRLLSTTGTTVSGIRFIPFYEFLGRNIPSPNCRLVIRKR